jgi:phenylacetaldehyde dehydrogenase
VKDKPSAEDLGDAELDKAIPAAAMGIFINSGQACVAGSRALVPRGVYQQVVEGIAALAGKMRLAGPNEGKVYSGPIISGRRLTASWAISMTADVREPRS